VDLSARGTLRRLMRLQRLAYGREARLIEYGAIPALRDTAASLRGSGESFYALFRGRKPLGMISVHRHDARAEICRLVVRPRYWGRGIASRLLEHVQRVLPGETLEVATAAANHPALELYRRHGFREGSRCTTSDGLGLVALRRPGRPPGEPG